MRAVIGHSDDVDEEDAIAEVIAQCREALAGEPPKAGMLFMSAEYDHQLVLDAIAEAWPDLPLIGSTSDGEMSSECGYRNDSIVLTLLAGAELTATAGVGRRLSEDPEAAVVEALGAIDPDDKPRIVLTTFAPSTDASMVLARINAHMPTTDVPVLGGLSGDHRNQSRIHEFCGSELLSDSLPLLFLGGDIQATWGSGAGWEPMGRAFRITESAGHIVHRIDDRPATDVYTLFYGEVPSGQLGAFPIAVSEDGPNGPWQLRAVLGTDMETGELRMAGGVGSGAWVSMTEVVKSGVLSGTLTSIHNAMAGFDGRPEVAFLFSCAARKWVLGSSAEDEIATVVEALPGTTDALGMAGLYVYGEIAPDAPGTPSVLHNETCITVLLGAA